MQDFEPSVVFDTQEEAEQFITDQSLGDTHEIEEIDGQFYVFHAE